MIRVNLALKKQAGGGGTGASTLFSGGGMPAFDLQVLKDMHLSKLVVPIVFVTMASYFLDNYKADEVKKVEASIEKVKAQNAKIQIEINKSKDYEVLKRQFDEDEKVVRTKLETIQSLIADRANPPKLLMGLAQGIPDKVWLSEIKVEKGSVSIEGYAIGFSEISDFMKGLTNSAFFSDVELKKVKKDEDFSSTEVDHFELKSKRR